MKILKENYKEILLLVIVFSLFIFASFLAKTYDQQLLQYFDGKGVESMFLYVLLTLITFVIAPLNSLPLLPVAVLIWGKLVTLIISLVSWTIGTVVTFYLSRKFGRPLVLRFIKEEQINKYEKAFSYKSEFLGLVILHAIFSGDILGYVLGLFVRKISYTRYAVASFIGNIPFAIVLVYASTADLIWQVAIGVLLVTVTALGLWSIGDKVLKQ